MSWIFADYVPAVSTPRLFYMTSVSGVFIATEVTCSFGSNERLCAFPFLQTELYNKVQQPGNCCVETRRVVSQLTNSQRLLLHLECVALFLLDHGTELYLWQGWWPESSDDNDNMSTGSAHLRWNVERRLAMETVIQYCNGEFCVCVVRRMTVEF